MKRILNYLIILLFFSSCKGQDNPKQKIDASKVKEITLVNKVNCTNHKLNSDNILIKDKKQIEKIINTFAYAEPIKTRVNTGAENGFFEVKFYEGEKEYYYTIIYTIYDGVIVSNDLNGDMYKNDRLEGSVYPLFVE